MNQEHNLPLCWGVKKQVLYLLKALASPLIALGTGALLCSLVIALFSPDPLRSIARFFTGPFSSPYYAGSLLNTASLLIWAALGSSLAFSAGCFNLGGEGQIYAAGLVSALVLHGLASLSPPLALSIALLAAISASALIASLSTFFRILKGTGELLTSFLISAAIIPLIDSVIAGPLRDTSQNLLATPPIAESLRLPQLLPPSAFNPSFFAGIGLCILVSIWFYASKSGRTFRICGTAREFGEYAGLSAARVRAAGMITSGALHGLTGFFAVCATYYTCPSGFYAGMGWNALTAALIAKTSPPAIVPACLLMGWLLTAAERATLVESLPFELSGLIQAAILLCISARLFSVRGQKKP